VSAEVPEFVEETAGRLSYDLIVEHDLKVGLWVGTLVEAKSDGLVCVRGQLLLKLLLTTSATSYLTCPPLLVLPW
jgi:hypothetical protein